MLASAKIPPCREIKNYDFQIAGISAWPRSYEGFEMFLDRKKSTMTYNKYWVQSDDHEGKARRVNFYVYDSSDLKAINLGSDVSDKVDGRYFVMKMQTGATVSFFYVEDNGGQCETGYIDGNKPTDYRIIELNFDPFGKPAS